MIVVMVEEGEDWQDVEILELLELLLKVFTLSELFSASLVGELIVRFYIRFRYVFWIFF